MTIQKPIVESFGEVVKATEAVLLAYLKTVNADIEQLHYEHGHPLEIVNTLAGMSETQQYQYKKYPIVMLFQDFTESIGSSQGYYGTANLTVVIANDTTSELTANERYQENFKKILYPIYEELIRQLCKHRDFVTVSEDKVKREKTDRLYWGRAGLYGGEANRFKDRLDAIEISGLQVTVRKTTNCLTPTFKTF